LKPAATAAKEKIIEFTAAYNNGYLKFETRNPTENNAVTKERRIPELERGMGTKILRHFAEQYDGELICNSTAGIYITQLIFKV